MADRDSTMAQSTENNPASSEPIVTAARGGSFLFLGHLFQNASRFVLGIILARSLGADGLGLFSLGLAVALALGAISRLGLLSAMERFLPPAIHQGNEVRIWGTLQVGMGLSAAASIFVAILLLVTASFVAVNLLDEPAVAPFLRLISVSVPLMSVGRVLLASVRSFQRMEYHVYAEDLTFSISRFVFTITFLALGFGVAGAMAAYALAWVLEIAVLLILLNHMFSLRRPLNPARRDVREILAYSAPLCLTTVIVRLGDSLEVFMLGLFSSLTSIGLFTAAARIQSVGGVLRTSTSRAARPIISELHQRGDHIQLERIYQAVTRWSISFLLPYSLTTILFAAPLLAIFGEDFETGTPVLIILSIGAMFSAATGVTSSMIVMTGHSRLSLVNTVVSLSLAFIASLLLIPKWGLIGAALAAVLSGGIMSVVRLFEVRGLEGLWPYSRKLIKPIIAGTVALCIGLTANRVFPAGMSLLYLILDITLLWLAYAATTLLLGLTPEDRMILSRTRRRFGILVSWR